MVLKCLLEELQFHFQKGAIIIDGGNSFFKDSLRRAEDLAKILADPAATRQLLLSAGFDKAILDKTSDADLMKMVQEVLSATTTTQ